MQFPSVSSIEESLPSEPSEGTLLPRPALEPQDPQATRLADALGDLRSRLEANGGDNPCAKLFGGIKNALKKLEIPDKFPSEAWTDIP